MRTITIAILLALAFAGAGGAHAHGLFWQAAPGGLELMEGHLPGQEHDGEAAAPLARSRVAVLLTAPCGAETGAATGWSEVALPDDGPVTAPVEAGAVQAVVDWGWWTKSAAGTRNVHPDSVPGALQAWRSVETVTHLAAGCAAVPAAAGRGLELRPVRAPGRLRPDAKLDLTVTLDGLPVADAVVTYDGKVRGTSGRDGAIRLKLRHGGLQVIRATLRRPAAAPAWAEDVQTGTLTFVLEDR